MSVEYFLMELKIDPTFDPTHREIDFITTLQDDDVFDNIVPRIRKKIGISTEGLITDIRPDKTISIRQTNKDKIDAKLLLKFIVLLLGLYDLPYYWYQTFLTILLFGLVTAPSKKERFDDAIETKYVGGIEKIIRRIDGDNRSRYVEIIVKEGMLFDDMIKVLRKRKAEIQILLDQLRIVPKIKLKNLTMFRVIKGLSEIMSDSEVGKEIEKYRKELDAPYSLDRKSINIYKKRYEKETEKLPKNYLYLDRIEALIK